MTHRRRLCYMFWTAATACNTAQGVYALYAFASMPSLLAPSQTQSYSRLQLNLFQMAVCRYKLPVGYCIAQNAHICSCSHYVQGLARQELSICLDGLQYEAHQRGMSTPIKTEVKTTDLNRAGQVSGGPSAKSNGSPVPAGPSRQQEQPPAEPQGAAQAEVCCSALHACSMVS